MTTWTPVDLSPRGPVYLAIADALARDIGAGLLTPGQRLPTHRALARTIGVNVVTITRAYAEAQRRGLVDGEVGRGTFVARGDMGSASHLPLAANRVRERGGIDLAFNLPALPAGTFDPSPLLGGLAEEGFDPLLAQYVPGGCEKHRGAGVEWIARSGHSVSADQVILTGGGQHAMSVAFGTLCGPGDTVLTEALTYPGVKALASLLHLRLLPVAMDEQGITPAALETACRKSNPKALYCMPTLQNPTGVVWSEERRLEILAIARRYELRVIEDDTTGTLLEGAPPPLAALAPDEVIFVTSTSKSLGPGLRIGFLALPESARTSGLHERALAVLAAQTWMTSPLLGELLTRLVDSGQADAILAARRLEISSRRRLANESLGELETTSHPACSYLWLLLPEPWRSAEFALEAERAGVMISAAESFAVGRAPAPHAVRACIGTPPDRTAVLRALAILRELAGRAQPVCRPFV